MAPIPLSTVDITNSIFCPADLKDVIQHLFEIQSAVHGYLGPETQQELVRKMYPPSYPCHLPHLRFHSTNGLRVMHSERTSPSRSPPSAHTPPIITPTHNHNHQETATTLPSTASNSPPRLSTT
ncbi:uncharacterized protein An18g03640 [Aspergillus niger]|uniref:Contig An18c0110, genomic contig n=2 Tax=Aspergillus niger TaxID=5061 RepID=A2RAM1_ASPNC|nr:uncharacterized protein An18g03640 [Aspergillus niger]CAK43192.1 unnamed protein product [Aspergillus niger]